MHHIEIVSQLEGPHLRQLPELLDAATRADGHEPLGEHKFLRLKRGDDLGAAVLAFEDGRLAGYAHTLAYAGEAGRRVSCEMVVHPELRQRGIGRMLLSHALMHAASIGAARIDAWAYNDSAATAAIARRFGFTTSRRLHHLHRHTAATPQIAAAPEAVVRAYRPGDDDAAWLALNNRIFADHPENGTWTLDDLRARLAQPWFDPGDFFVLEEHGGLAAFCWVKIEERGDEGRVGEIYVIGVAPERQGRGYARFLLGVALDRMRERGAATAAIYVDASNAPALALYGAAGFHHHHVDVCYSRDLRPAARMAPPDVIEDEAAA